MLPSSDVIPVTEAPTGTIGDAQARVGALKDKYGGAPSSSSLPSSSPSPPARTTASSQPNPKPAARRAADAGEVILGGTEEDPDRGLLFGGARKVPPPPVASPPQASPSVATEVNEVTPAVTSGAVQGDVDLGDLEASLGDEGQEGVEEGGDDLDAIIEAARKEAEALGIGEEGVDEESSEDDIDLT